MSGLHRALTWEISDSESESDASKASRLNGDEEDDDEEEPEEEPASAPIISSETPGEPEIEAKTPRKKRRSREEIQAELEEREKLREEKHQEREKLREEKHQEREKLREEKQQEREKLREEKLQERLRRRAAAEQLDQLKPHNYIKRLSVNVHAGLLQDAGCDVLLEALDDLGWRNRIESQGLPYSITWTRPVLQTEEGEVDEEDQAVVVLTHTQFDSLLVSHKPQAAVEGIDDITERAESLLQQLSEHQQRSSGKVVTVLVLGPRYRTSLLPPLFPLLVCVCVDRDEDAVQQLLDLEELLVHLQLSCNVAVNFVSSWSDVTDHVTAVTRALSKKPYKALGGGLDLGFCTDGAWSGGVRVERDGRGLAQAWSRQIQQLNRVSAGVARAVTSAFPSPWLLLQAYQKLREGERRLLLADLPVVGGASERRVGPELSGRIYRLFTSSNPDLLLD